MFISSFAVVKAETAISAFPFNPDASAEEISKPEIETQVSPNTESQAPAKASEILNIPLRFQLADPKGPYIEIIKEVEKPIPSKQKPITEEKLQISPTEKKEVAQKSKKPKKDSKKNNNKTTKKSKNKKKQPKAPSKEPSKSKNTVEHEQPSFTKEDIQPPLEKSSETLIEFLPSEKEQEPVSQLSNKASKKNTTDDLPEKQLNEAKADDIDYYLKKYKTALKGEANLEEFQYSLVEPFKQSLFYDVLKENNYETIELLTNDINADFKPEAIVSYNVPLGTSGEYACQLMILEPNDGDLNKIWVSELIPGEIDKVMVSDVNNDAQADVVVVSMAGGVSLLKSIRIYSFDKSKNTMKTIFAMNGIMEGIVSIRPGKILISETFPGGINRAALYVWNGKRFERLEL